MIAETNMRFAVFVHLEKVRDSLKNVPSCVRCSDLNSSFTSSKDGGFIAAKLERILLCEVFHHAQ